MVRKWSRYLSGAIAAVTCWCLVVASPVVMAQDQQSSPWRSLPGELADIAINDVAQAYAVSISGEALRWRATDQRWSRMSGKFIRITGAEGNRPWAVSKEGIVSRFNGLWWEAKGNDVLDVAGDAIGNVVIAGNGAPVQKWEPLSNSWQNIKDDFVAIRVALGPNGQPWVIDKEFRIFRFVANAWQSLPGFARDIAVGGNGTAVIADRDGRIRVWLPEEKRWNIVSGIENAAGVAATPKGHPWVVDTDGRLRAAALIKKEDVLAEPENQAPTPSAPVAQAPSIQAAPILAPSAQINTPTPSQSNAESNKAPEAKAPEAQTAQAGQESSASASTTGGSESPGGGGGSSGDPGATTTTENIEFTDTRKTAAHVEIGSDGSVFVLITGGTIKRWSNDRKDLDDFPGLLARIAIDPMGNPWGVTSLGRVFRHNGMDWKQIVGATASDIAIGSNGDVVTADADSNLARYNSVTGRFERISGRGIQVAVAPDGSIWTIRDDNVVQRCDTESCTPVNRLARAISIGPDASIFLVTTNNQLLRRKPDSDNFERVRTRGETPSDVAVGPNGFPWIVTSNDRLFYSRLFERDESTDRNVALRTSDDTAGSGATAAVVSSQSSSGFTFTKNLRFDAFKSSDPDASFGMLEALYVGQDNSVFIRQGSTVFEFNERNEKFEAMDAEFPETVKDISTDADGVIWGLSNTSATVYRIKGTQVKTYTITSGTGTTPRNIAVTGAGDVYAAIGASIWLKESGSSVFREQTEFGDSTVLNVAIAGAGDLWITNQSAEVQQWTGSKFENRPKGTAQFASSIRASADGTIYVVNNNKILRWNATNSSFDEVNATNVTATFDQVGVTNQGRPWAANTSAGGEDIFRARD